MASSRIPARGIAVLIALIAAAIVVWIRAVPDERERTTPTPAPAARMPVRGPVALPSVAPRHAASVPIQVHGRHLIDPCAPPFEADPPEGFDSTTVDGVTIAWIPGGAPTPGVYDTALQPTSLAHLVLGTLAEAAQLTGTPPRAQLTVVIYPSREDYLSSTGAPSWSGGIYDGGSVRLYLQSGADLAVPLTHLRHEVMHAQIHTGVGCAPVWFNEGLAMYFAGEPPTAEWIRMLRTPEPLLLTALEAPSIDDANTERIDRIYAQSVALVSYIVDHGGEAGVQHAVDVAKQADRRGALWTALYPNADHVDVLGTLGQKLFGMAFGDDLHRTLEGKVCCFGLKNIGTVGCRRAPPGLGDRLRTDASISPRALCDPHW